ncbi:MAG: zinc metalloprotease HtpX [Bacteroidia bacterium]
MSWNTLKSTLLLGLLTVLLVMAGQALGGQAGMTIALIMAGLMNFISFFYSDKIVLSAYGAKPLPRETYDWLYADTERLCQAAGLPMPQLYLIPNAQPNAFATGRSPTNAAVAVTQGLLENMSRYEVRGVIAHELAHIKNRDTLIMTIAATLAGAITYLAQMFGWMVMFSGRDDREDSTHGIGGLLMVILAPIAAMLIQLAISRAREYEADRSAAQYLGSPRPLASALQKLGYLSSRIPMEEASPATAHLFIVNPLSGGWVQELFSTHPPLEKRIQKLLSYT